MWPPYHSSSTRQQPRDRAIVRAVRVWILCGSVLLAGGRPATSLAQEQPHLQDRPLLQQLNRETQALYEEALSGLVRVELPTPKWANQAAQRNQLLKRWPNLRPDVKRQIERNVQGRAAHDRPGATQPARSDDRPDEPGADGQHEAIVVMPSPPGAEAAAPERVSGGRMEPRRHAEPGRPVEPARPVEPDGRMEPDGGPTNAFDPNNVGMLLDAKGHLLVPLYIEPETAGENPVRVAGGDGVVRQATFVGSDRQTNLTVLKLQPPGGDDAEFEGVAIRLGRDRPADGTLVLHVGLQDACGRLGVWTGADTDCGIVFSIDGTAAGIARYGQFLNGPACRLIADQIIRHGRVKRATLGVVISEIRQDDPLRRRVPVLGDRSAMLISQVVPGSPAKQAGLRAGDLLVSVSGEAVGDLPSLAAAIANCSGRTELQVVRRGKVLDAVVELKQE